MLVVACTPGHMGFLGNEHADTMEKEGALILFVRPEAGRDLCVGKSMIKSKAGPGGTSQTMEVYARPKIVADACEGAICLCVQVSSQGRRNRS